MMSLRPWRAEPPQKAAREVMLEDARVRQPSWSRTWLAPSYQWGDTARAPALEVLAEILGGGASSRLYRALVVDNKVAVGAGAWYSPDNLGPATFGLYASPRQGVEMDTAADAAMAELQRILSDGVTKDELARAKRRMRAQTVFARDSFGTGARVLGAALSAGRTIADVEAWPERIGAVTAADIQAAAKAVVEGGPAVTSRLLAKPQG